MVQLRVYYNETQYWLDLYEEDLPKISLSIEDIIDAEATSTYSRTFRVPNTQNNYKFFKTAFDVNGVDFDVTIKKRAEVLVDGVPFKDGQLRLQKIYNNVDLDKIEYEVIFFGETRNFASFLGDRPLNQMPLDLSHISNEDNVVLSWQAYPQGALTAGLLNGDVIYPLIDHGNFYNEDGTPIGSQVKTDTSSHSKAFIQNSHPLLHTRFKPMIRAKALIDGLFAQTPYTYESDFLDSNLFRKVYVSAWGNDASNVIQLDRTQNTFLAYQSNFLNGRGTGNIRVNADNEINDYGDNYNPTTYLYTVPANGNYIFQGNAGVNVGASFGSTAWGTAAIGVQAGGVGPFTFYDGNSTNNGQVTIFQGLTLNAGDVVGFFITMSPAATNWSIYNGNFRAQSAPGLYNPVLELDNEYKQVDFLKDILLLFRLVMAPTSDDPFKFKIEPWKDYIASGTIWDWSSKLDRNKDTTLEPLFFTQTDRIEFKFNEDEDYINDFNQKTFKQVYGQLNFESNSELLKGTKEFTVEFSPTPMAQIEGDPNTSSWVLPKVHTHETEDTGLQHVPMRANTRILFYTGLKPTSETWYFGLGADTYDVYPLVSYLESWPAQATDLNLNWARWFGYWGGAVAGYPELVGQSLYERYWSQYIESLYDKFGRRYTGTFILDTYDLRTFTFDDVIFIDGTYYRPEKIIDLPVGERGPTKVELIKINDFITITADQPPQPTFYYYEVYAIANDCGAILAVPFIMQSTVPLTVGDVVSALGNSTCYQVIAPASTNIFDLVYSQTYTDCTSCYGEVQPTYNYTVTRWLPDCGGLDTVTLVTSSPTIWAPGTTVTLTGIEGCWLILGETQATATTTIENDYVDCETCQTGNPPISTFWKVTECLNPSTELVVEWNLSNIQGQSVTLQEPEWSGCWFVIEETTGPATATIQSIYDNCTACFEAQQPLNSYDAINCIDGSFTIVGTNQALNPGQIVTLDSIPGCWQILNPTNQPPFANVLGTFVTCEDCAFFGG